MSIGSGQEPEAEGLEEHIREPDEEVGAQGDLVFQPA